MNNTPDQLPLAAEFPPADREQWRKLVVAMFKGASFEKKLLSQTYDGLRIEPLYERRADARPVAARRPAAPWQILQRADHLDAGVANTQALHDLENGARGLSLIFAGSIGAHGFGISVDAIPRVLEGIYLDAGIAIECDLSPQSKDAGQAIAALVKSRGIAPKDTHIRFGYDPLGVMAASGQSPLRWNDLAGLFAGIISDLAAQGFTGPFAAADARIIHNAGGAEAQELGFALAAAVTYLRAFEAHGIPLDAARRMIFFRLSADADQFMTMAKFRALRKLWARVEDACGLTPLPAFVSAETAWRMMTKRDVYVNMLRGTIAAFSAGLGGANAVTMLPFTAALGLPDAFARRIARNTQLILLEESNLAKVADPAASSGGIEDLTDKLCMASWKIFQDIEAAGGAAAAIEAGLIQAKVTEVRKARETAIATREDAITGSSEFPDLAETPVTVLDVAPVAISKTGTAIVTFTALPSRRLAEPYERLRDAAERAAKDGAPPKIFLATLGNASDFTARATFAKNFFEAGGIAAAEFFPSPLSGEVKKEMIAAFKQSGAKLACICSSNDIYERKAADIAKALTSVGARHVYLVGRPGDIEQKLRDAGVKTFVFSGCDALATLTAAHDILKI